MQISVGGLPHAESHFRPCGRLILVHGALDDEMGKLHHELLKLSVFLTKRGDIRKRGLRHVRANQRAFFDGLLLRHGASVSSI